MEHRDWRHWTGTVLMAGAVVAFVTNWINPPPDDASGALQAGFYIVGVVLLGIGWWLRRSAEE